jgi:hypothetical protein
MKKGASIIKLHSLEDIFNKIRYLLCSSILAFGFLGTLHLIRQNIANKYLLIFLIFSFLSCWVLAKNPIKNIISPYKDLKNFRMQKFRTLIHIILTTLWIFGLIIGVLFLVIIINALVQSSL